MTSGTAGATTTWALHTSASSEEANLHLAALESCGLLGIAETDGHTTIYLRQRGNVPLPGRWEQVADRDWNEVWKAALEPVTVGAITIVPPWLVPSDAGDENEVLVIEPGQAFGTGHHETTTAVLAAVQGDVPVAGRSVLDVGTGTGVLALAAARLGAAQVVAVDIDPLAVAAAHANAGHNGESMDVRLGSVESVAGAVFDVVLANLDTATLTVLAPALAATVAPLGVLVAAGVSNERAGQAAAALRSVGMASVARRGREWTLLLARRDGS